MIYDITLHTKLKETRMYLSAESKAGLYKRCLEMYRIGKDDVTINDILEDPDINIGAKKKIQVTREFSEEAKEILNSTIRGLSQEDIQSRLLKGFKLEEIKFKIEDIDKLVRKYDKVKVYYRRTGAKKNKEYIALCK